jgi:IstB-like ATP binding protein
MIAWYVLPTRRFICTTRDLYDITPAHALSRRDKRSASIGERHKHGPLITTCNHTFEEWAQVFGNHQFASPWRACTGHAALDGLMQQAHTLVIHREGYRQRSRRKEVSGEKSSFAR